MAEETTNQFTKWADFLWPLGGTLFGLLVVPLAIDQYPDFFHRNRWLLPVSLVIVLACWLVPLCVHERAQKSYRAIVGVPKIGSALGVAVVVAMIVTFLVASWGLFRFHNNHLDAALRKEASLEQPKAKESKSPAQSKEGMEQIAELDRIFASRDELGLREFYGFPQMVNINIAMNTQRRLNYARTGSPNTDLTPFIQGREMELDVQYSPDNLKRTEAGIVFIPDINTVSLLILPTPYSVNKKALLRYENSFVLPGSVVDRVKEFDRTLQDNTDALLRVMNIAMRENPDYFMLHDNPDTRFFRAIEGRYYDQFKPLRPEADKIRDAIRSSMNP